MENTYKYNTLQELFDTILSYSRTMTEKSSNVETGKCYYKHPFTGNKCFIGALIPDEKYNEDFEGEVADNKLILNAASINPSLRKCVAILQEIHDNQFIFRENLLELYAKEHD